MGDILLILCFIHYIACSIACFSSSVYADSLAVDRAFLSEKMPHPAALSSLNPVPSDAGVQNAIFATKDNNTTGIFTGHQ